MEKGTRNSSHRIRRGDVGVKGLLHILAFKVPPGGADIGKNLSDIELVVGLLKVGQKH